MSLTRAEWEEMWESVVMIEHFADYLLVGKTRPDINKKVLMNCKRIKAKIQKVIGQME